MEPMQISYREFYFYIMIAGAIIGLVLGLIPLILGRRRGYTRLGVYGLIASTVCGAIAPVISVVIVAVFSWVIVKKHPPIPDEDPPAADSDQA
ncbi:MAG TPA: hypothetical protein VK468_01095 [Pyrinomonadaceae bacterium]|jgi:MFS family permease|nr:hypothetical protein [Pyrinomonadaceae bacterium]